jgi:hypothetical protein
MEFITRLYFINLYFPEKLSHTFDQQRIEVETHIQRLGKLCAELPDEQIYNRMSLEMRLKQLKFVQKWLDDCQEYFK